MNNNILVQLNNITKTFPGVVAIDNVDFDVKYGEIHALVGENGAGKSTLIKVLGGVFRQDSGDIIFEAKKVNFSSTRDSLLNKISVIFQEFNLIPDLSVAENIFIGREPKILGNLFMNYKKINSDAKMILDNLEIDINPKKLINELSVIEKQMIEIAKAISFEAKLIIMDEPTATLADKEVDKLFEIIRSLKAKGVSIIYISHRLEEAFELSDRITVLRDGRKIETLKTSNTSQDEIIQMMVGRVVKDYFAEIKDKHDRNEVLLEIKNYSIADFVYNVSFKLYKGEILALAGLLGSGAHQLLKSLYGIFPKKGGDFYFEGIKSEVKSPGDAIKLGLGFVTEDRKESGIFFDESVLHNTTIIIIKSLVYLKSLFINSKKELVEFNNIKNKLDIKFSSPNQLAIGLSGGNQQKVILARTLLSKTKALILLEPTRGIDVGTKAEIHKILRELSDSGISILMTSSELPELVNIPDRVIVFYKGEVAGEFDRESMNEEKLVAAQIGQKIS